MRGARLVFALGIAACGIAGCGTPASGAKEPAPATVPRLLPPPALGDLDSPSAMYRTGLALQLQPSWAQFLDDCRLRLPASHPLNAMGLVAWAEMTIDGAGQVLDVQVQSSGNADFDRAVRQVIVDAVPLPRPPRELWSDDDRVHVKWLFARDRRQAGPATAEVVMKELPLGDVVKRLVDAKDLTRAAGRIKRAAAGPERDAATHLLMVKALDEGLANSQNSVRRAAVEGIGRATVGELAPALRQLLTSTTDVELRLVTIRTLGMLGDRGAVPVLLDLLRRDVRGSPDLVAAEISALEKMGAARDAGEILRPELEGSAVPNPIALDALAMLPITELDAQVETWAKTGDVRVRAAACGRAKWPTVAKLLKDRDATVRARCAEAITRRAPGTAAEMRAIKKRARELVKDRDNSVRANAVLALAVLDPGTVLDVSKDRAVVVRVAYARALAVVQPSMLQVLLSDHVAAVRAAAWSVIEPKDHPTLGSAAAAAAADPSPEVRRAAVKALEDEALLRRLAASDDDPGVRTEALVLLAGRQGRASITGELLDRFASASPGSAERVRTALAWLLAR